MNQQMTVYTRNIDSGTATQTIIVDNTGKIVKQAQSGKVGGAQYPNAALIGRNIKDMRGLGFKKQRMSDEAYLDMMSTL